MVSNTAALTRVIGVQLYRYQALGFLHWAYNFYYDRLSYELRESKVYVHENNWAAAAEQWRMLLNSRWQPYRFMAAYNLALYHEMTDEIDQAITYLDLAEETATTQIIDTSLVKEYREVLLNRKKELKQLEQCHQSTRR